MKKRTLALLTALILCVSFWGCSQQAVCNCTCGAAADTDPTAVSTTGEAPTEAAVSHDVETIDLTGKNGSIRYEGIRFATAALLEPNSGNMKDGDAVLVTFTFTLSQNRPAKCKDVFKITYYQNGLEVKDDLWISSSDSDQYDLCGRYHLELMDGTTTTFARPIPVGDSSPMTVMVTDLADPENYQIMVIDITP